MCIIDHLMTISFGISGLIFQAKVTELATNVGQNILSNITSGFVIT